MWDLPTLLGVGYFISLAADAHLPPGALAVRVRAAAAAHHPLLEQAVRVVPAGNAGQQGCRTHTAPVAVIPSLFFLL